MGALHEVSLQFPEMTIGPLHCGVGFLVFTHRLFQGQVIWGHLESYLLVLAWTSHAAFWIIHLYGIPASELTMIRNCEL